MIKTVRQWFPAIRAIETGFRKISLQSHSHDFQYFSNNFPAVAYPKDSSVRCPIRGLRNRFLKFEKNSISSDILLRDADILVVGRSMISKIVNSMAKMPAFPDVRRHFIKHSGTMNVSRNRPSSVPNLCQISAKSRNRHGNRRHGICFL